MFKQGLFRNAPWALFVAVFATPLWGAVTDISQTPMVTSYSASVKPNLLFVLDNSGSMAWTHLPDDNNDAGSAVTFDFGFYGYRSSQCNGIYYNPHITYTLPIKADGTSYPNANFFAAKTDGYAANPGTVNLSTGFKAETDGVGEPAYYFNYTGTQTTAAQKDYHSTTNDFFKECNSALNAAPGVNVFTKVVVGAGEQQNFANWYSYYRTRILAMKSAAGLAFSTLDANYRVGFMTLNSPSATFLNVGPFETTQRTNWYKNLYGISPSGSTGLRKSLADAGLYYAKKLSIANTTVDDPIEYSCQQNFTILSTDGFWNSGEGYKLDGTPPIGNQDGDAPRPYFDGATVTYTKNTSRVDQTQTQNIKTETQWQKRTEQIQTRTSSLRRSTASLQQRTQRANGTWRAWGNAATCTWNATTECRYATWSAFANAANCTENESTDTSIGTTWTGNGARCQYAAWSAWANANSCTAAPQSPASPYIVGTARECQTTDTGWVNVNSSCAGSVGVVNGQTISCQEAPISGPAPASCTAGTTTSGTGLKTTCVTNTLFGPQAVSSCTPEAAAAANNYVATTCQTVATGPTSVASCTAETPDASNNWTTTTCAAVPSGGTFNTLADVAMYYYKTDLRTVDLDNCTGASGETVCALPDADGNDKYNNVPSGGVDSASWQHMTTFTLALGAQGRMVYSKTYPMDRGTNYWSVATEGCKNGSTVTVNIAGVNTPYTCSCPWKAVGETCDWPTPGMANASDGKIENIDDTWHAAVNGRGLYFSATNPEELNAGLQSALASVSARKGSAAAATTSNPNVSTGDNFVFSSVYRTAEWVGELIRQQLDPVTGLIPTYKEDDPTTFDWRAQSQLDDKACTPPSPCVYTDSKRNIYTYSAAAADRLKSFVWGNLSADEKAYFTKPHVALSQFCTVGLDCLSATDQTNASGEKLVKFLRGDRTHESEIPNASGDPIPAYYNARVHVMGDIVSSEAVYVKNPTFTYTDSGYGDFISAQAARAPVVYVGANDGMLHAFNAGDSDMSDTTGDGAEIWAYAPSFVLPTLHKLADKNYANNHRFFVDGTPVIGDICPNAPGSTCTAAQWKTILVGGLNAGGRGYYALDVTDPLNPKALWEFTDANMGYTYGNPVITKLKNGTWVVLVTSGYNNVPDSLKNSGDGKGYLYVLNANTGALITTVGGTGKIATGIGSVDTPSGLARITPWVDDVMNDNTALRVYGGDLLGNLWRFDINNTVGAGGYDAQLLASFKDAANKAQPITAKPELGEVGGIAVAYVGTGRFLGVSDISDSSPQSFYAVKDSLNITSYGSPRANTCASGVTANCFVKQTQTIGTCAATGDEQLKKLCNFGETVHTSTNNPVNFATGYGWYIDLPESGERANTDPALVFGTLAFNTNVPSPQVCNLGGYSNRYYIDFRTGAPVWASKTALVAERLGESLASRGVIASLPSGKIIQITRMSDSTTVTSEVPIGSGAATTQRTGWRELTSDH